MPGKRFTSKRAKTANTQKKKKNNQMPELLDHTTADRMFRRFDDNLRDYGWRADAQVRQEAASFCSL
jgi:hypothetical protein